jgi:hypothetical protein
VIASVLSPGPSLARVTARDLEDTTIFGVNRAAERFRCDWRVFGDDRMYTTYPIDYSPKLATCAESKRRLGLVDCLTYEELFPQYPPNALWMIYTCNAALVIAASQGAKVIRLYGCDRKGIEDFDGHKYTFAGEEAHLTRTPKRWENEARMFDSTVAMLAEKQVKVERITYGTA